MGFWCVAKVCEKKRTRYCFDANKEGQKRDIKEKGCQGKCFDSWYWGIIQKMVG